MPQVTTGRRGGKYTRLITFAKNRKSIIFPTTAEILDSKAIRKNSNKTFF